MNLNELINETDYRRALALKNHQAFFAIYFNDYIHYKSAKFHKELFRITEDDSLKMSVIVAFRGSAKSTISTFSYPIWAVITGKAKFIVIITQNQVQGRMILDNIKRQFETNQLLKSDFGPFQDPYSEWTTSSIYIKKYDAKIIVASVGEAIRGIRHNSTRPQIIICDDVEDTLSAKTKDGRSKTYHWFTGEVLPLGTPETKVVVIGNLLHRDCLVMRLKRQIEKGEFNAVYREYPLMKNGRILWTGKYNNHKIIQQEKARIGDLVTWKREYMLELVADDDQLVRPEWIKKYSEMPTTERGSGRHYMSDIMGVDLAISQKDHADFTAIVKGSVFDFEGKPHIFIHPDVVNRKMLFAEACDTIKLLYANQERDHHTDVVIESVGYQAAMTEVLGNDGVNVHSASNTNVDKRTRLSIVARFIKNGQILFPKEGADELITQILDFGIEKHDDMMDAFCYLVLHVTTDYRRPITADDIWFF